MGNSVHFPFTEPSPWKPPSLLPFWAWLFHLPPTNPFSELLHPLPVHHLWSYFLGRVNCFMPGKVLVPYLQGWVMTLRAFLTVLNRCVFLWGMFFVRVVTSASLCSSYLWNVLTCSDMRLSEMETMSQSCLTWLPLECSGALEGVIRTTVARTLLCFNIFSHKLSYFLNVSCLGKICVLVCLWLL